MSEEMQKQINQLSQNIQILNARIVARNQSINDSIDLNLNLRTDLNLFMNSNQELMSLTQAKDMEICRLNEEKTALVASIASLQAEIDEFKKLSLERNEAISAALGIVEDDLAA